MPIPFILPKLDMDQESGTIVEWLVEEGEFVKQGDPVLIIETDKVAVEVEAPASGKLAGISAQPGDVVPVTETIALILDEDESLPGVTGADPSRRQMSPSHMAKPTPVAARMAQEMGIDLTAVPTSKRQIDKDDIKRYVALQEMSDKKETVEVAVQTRVKFPATPAARRMAAELGIPLAQIDGSGPGRRVQAADVESFFQELNQMDNMGLRPATRTPLSSVRRTIAERMQASFQEIPHIALSVEVDVTALEVTRVNMNNILSQVYLGKGPYTLEAGSEAPPVVRVSLTAMLVRLVAWCLARHSLLNASLIENEIVEWSNINIGVATAVKDGLVVPVIREADKMTVAEISRRLADLADRAKTGKLTLSDVHGGTFTITNLGMFGIDRFRAIINPPQSAILAVGRITRKPVVVDRQDNVEVRPMMNLTLSADHRVIDGVIGAHFLGDLVKVIEAPGTLLL